MYAEQKLFWFYFCGWAERGKPIPRTIWAPFRGGPGPKQAYVSWECEEASWVRNLTSVSFPTRTCMSWELKVVAWENSLAEHRIQRWAQVTKGLSQWQKVGPLSDTWYSTEEQWSRLKKLPKPYEWKDPLTCQIFLHHDCPTKRRV